MLLGLVACWSAHAQTRVVMMDGKLLDADALRSAAGFSGRPKTVY